MQEKAIEFYSDQIRLRGTFYLPDDYDPTIPYPCLIACSGYTGLNAIYPRLFAQALTTQQMVVLGFDYRGCGESDGVRGRLLLDEQVRDIRNSVTFAKYQDEINLSGIGLLGWGMGGGLVVSASRLNPDVKAVIGVNGFYNGRSFLRSSFTEEGFAELLEMIENDKRDLVFKGIFRLTDPFDAYPLDPDTRDVVDERLRPVEHYNIQTSFELAESIYLFDATLHAEKLTQPLFIAHGKKNKLHPFELAEELKQVVPTAEYYEIDGKHNDFMTLNNPEFQKLTRAVAGWFKKQEEVIV